MSDDLPDWYIRRYFSRVLQGLPVELPKFDPEPENLFSIELARTERAIRNLRAGGIKVRPL